MDIGAELRAAREAKGLSLGTLAQRTRVQPRTLAAIEANNLAAIPPRPFGRGFVRAYAAEVDLDPEQTVHNYFAQFPPVPEPMRPTQPRAPFAGALEPPSQWASLGTAGAILAVLVLVALMVGGGSEAPGDASGRSASAPASDDAIGTSGTAARPSSAPSPASTDDASSPPGAAPVAPPLRLAVTVTRPCWIAATTDGKRAIYRIVQSGEQLTLDAQRDIAIRFGDAGAVEWSLNGRKGAALGAAGEVRDLTCRDAACR